jgi:hypothetical protein
MGYGIHRGTSNSRTLALPAVSSSFTNHDTAVLGISKYTDRRTTTAGNSTNFTTRQSHLSPAAIASVQRRSNTGTSTQLAATSRLHLNIVNHGAQRNSAQWHAVAYNRLNRLATFNFRTGCKSFWCENVSLLTIRVLNQRNSAASVRIVLNVSNRTNNAVFVSLKVNLSIKALMPTPTMPCGDLTLIVATTLFLIAGSQLLLGSLLLVSDFTEVTDRRPSATWSYWLVKSNAH